MKVFHLVLKLTAVALLFTACKKDNDPYYQDYYHNKKINLKISGIDVEDADNFRFTIAGMGVGLEPLEPAVLMKNGEEQSENTIQIVTADFKDNPVNITTRDSAWEFVVEYNFINNSNITSVILTPSFDDVEQEPITYYLEAGQSKSGTLQIKNYK